MVPHVHRCVLLCTSPIQVVNARSALDVMSLRDGLPRKLSVLIIHPLLGPQTKCLINYISECLGCEFIKDYSAAYDQMLQDGKEGTPTTGTRLWTARKRAQLLVDNYQKHQNLITTQLGKELGTIDYLFCRESAQHREMLFIREIGNSSI